MTVRPSVPPSVRTTGLPIRFITLDKHCAESHVFLARNRMLTRVVAKQAKTTKVKKNLLMEKKVQREYLPRRFCSNSVGTPLEFAASRSGFDAKYSRTSAFWFFLSTTMVFTAFPTHFARKNTSIFMLIGSLSRRKK